MTCLVQDITPRRRAERRLKARTEELERANGELQLALDSIKTLKGLVPICAHCKSIRNDEGFWQVLEVYVTDHSEAEFSHGICPACAQTHYPGLLSDLKQEHD